MLIESGNHNASLASAFVCNQLGALKSAGEDEFNCVNKFIFFLRETRSFAALEETPG